MTARPGRQLRDRVALRPCLERDPDTGRQCRILSPGPRCPEHARAHDAHRRAVYDDPRWRRLRRRRIREHVARFGPWCPGWRVPAHPSHDLVLDHDVPLEHGGAPFDPLNTVVGCRACNDRKGTSIGGWGPFPAAPFQDDDAGGRDAPG